jgi:hypothetical protein
MKDFVIILQRKTGHQQKIKKNKTVPAIFFLDHSLKIPNIF